MIWDQQIQEALDEASKKEESNMEKEREKKMKKEETQDSKTREKIGNFVNHVDWNTLIDTEVSKETLLAALKFH